MLKCLIILISIILVLCDEITVGRGGKCGPFTEKGQNHYANCGPDLECKNGYCESISYIGLDVAYCRDKLYSIGLPKGSIVSLVEEGYCFYEDNSCKKIYSQLPEFGDTANYEQINNYCKKCNYCLKIY